MKFGTSLSISGYGYGVLIVPSTIGGSFVPTDLGSNWCINQGGYVETYVSNNVTGNQYGYGGTVKMFVSRSVVTLKPYIDFVKDGTTDGGIQIWKMELNNIRIPTGKTLTYNGSLQKGVDEGEGYTLTSHQAINAGTYTAIATLTDPENTKWSDHTVEPKKITYKINKLSVSVPQSKTYYYTGSTINYSETSSYYTLSGQTSGISIGTYTAKANLKDTNNTQWSDGTITEKTVTWYIERQTTPSPGGGGSGGGSGGSSGSGPTLSCTGVRNYGKTTTGEYNITATWLLSDSDDGLKTGSYSVQVQIGSKTVVSNANITSDGQKSVGGGGSVTLPAGTYSVTVRLTTTVYDLSGHSLSAGTSVSGGTITVP